MLRNQSRGEATEITLQWPAATPSLMVVNVIWDCTRMVLGCAWSITAIHCVNHLLQGLNSKHFKLLLPSLRQKLLDTFQGCVLSFCTSLRDGQRGFLEAKRQHWKPLICKEYVMYRGMELRPWDHYCLIKDSLLLYCSLRSAVSSNVLIGKFPVLRFGSCQFQLATYSQKLIWRFQPHNIPPLSVKSHECMKSNI